MKLDASGEQWKLQLNELEEIRNEAYKSSRIYKDKAKAFYDRIIQRKHFEAREKVLLFHLRLKILPGRLRSCWSRRFVITNVFSNSAVEIKSMKTGKDFKVNGHRLKPYCEPFMEQLDEVPLHKPTDIDG
ncbi:uncharacterized protein LOC116119440 [Pistacia vera]|uniref:uncharacterized protein LOC116119440 n=1 Tax=Pistacia vera TaxID=55513 RepID=UPI0012633423|nr:uncharacterized protein LOC116119440 [Pistacia vera]